MNIAVLRSRDRNLRRGLGALAGLALLVVGVPAVLLVLSRVLLDSPNPLGGMTAPWTWSVAEIDRALTQALDNQTVISTIARVGLALSWIALVAVVISVAVEVRSLRVHAFTCRHSTGSAGRRRSLGVSLLGCSPSRRCSRLTPPWRHH